MFLLSSKNHGFSLSFIVYLLSHAFICERRCQMFLNNIEMDLKMRMIESETTQTELSTQVGVSLAYVNRITKGREQILNKTFVKMMERLGYDVQLTYVKREEA